MKKKVISMLMSLTLLLSSSMNVMASELSDESDLSNVNESSELEIEKYDLPVHTHTFIEGMCLCGAIEETKEVEETITPPNILDPLNILPKEEVTNVVIESVFKELTLETIVNNIKITVSGIMPEDATLKASYIGTSYKVKKYEKAINEETPETEEFEAIAVFDITVLNSDGSEYQPQEYGHTLDVSIKNVDTVSNEQEDKELAVFRVNDDNSVDKMNLDVGSNEVSFETEHFTVYVFGELTDNKQSEYIEDGLRFLDDTKTTVTGYTKDLVEGSSSYLSQVNGKLTLTLPSTVTEIAENAFENCDAAEVFIYPSSLYSISNKAFYNASFLEIKPSSSTAILPITNDALSSLTMPPMDKYIEISDMISFIGKDAFNLKKGGYYLKTKFDYAKVTTVSAVFDGISFIEISGGSVSNVRFSNMKDLRCVWYNAPVFNDYGQAIYDHMFENCSSLQAMGNFSGGVWSCSTYSIDEYAFSGCSSFNPCGSIKVVFPKCQEIASYAFLNSGISELAADTNDTSFPILNLIKAHAFEGVSFDKVSFCTDNGYTSLGKQRIKLESLAFNNASINKLTIGDNVTIENNAFNKVIVSDIDINGVNNEYYVTRFIYPSKIDYSGSVNVFYPAEDDPPTVIESYFRLVEYNSSTGTFTPSSSQNINYNSNDDSASYISLHKDCANDDGWRLIRNPVTDPNAYTKPCTLYLDGANAYWPASSCKPIRSQPINTIVVTPNVKTIGSTNSAFSLVSYFTCKNFVFEGDSKVETIGINAFDNSSLLAATGQVYLSMNVSPDSKTLTIYNSAFGTNPTTDLTVEIMTEYDTAINILDSSSLPTPLLENGNNHRTLITNNAALFKAATGQTPEDASVGLDGNYCVLANGWKAIYTRSVSDSLNDLWQIENGTLVGLTALPELDPSTLTLFIPEGIENIRGSVFSGIDLSGVNGIVFPETLKKIDVDLLNTLSSKQIEFKTERNNGIIEVLGSGSATLTSSIKTSSSVDVLRFKTTNGADIDISNYTYIAKSKDGNDSADEYIIGANDSNVVLVESISGKILKSSTGLYPFAIIPPSGITTYNAFYCPSNPSPSFLDALSSALSAQGFGSDPRNITIPSYNKLKKDAFDFYGVASESSPVTVLCNNYDTNTYCSNKYVTLASNNGAYIYHYGVPSEDGVATIGSTILAGNSLPVAFYAGAFTGRDDIKKLVFDRVGTTMGLMSRSLMGLEELEILSFNTQIACFDISGLYDSKKLQMVIIQPDGYEETVTIPATSIPPNFYDESSLKHSLGTLITGTAVIGKGVYVPKGNLVNITYNLNGGNVSDSAIYAVKGSPIGIGNATKEGYKFLGWTYQGHTTPTKNMTLTTSSDVTLDANWERLGKIVYHSNLGVLSQEHMYYDLNLGTPTLETPTKEGFTFSGWYKDSALTTPLNDSDYIESAISSNDYTIDVYAKWAISSSYQQLIPATLSFECIDASTGLFKAAVDIKIRGSIPEGKALYFTTRDKFKVIGADTGEHIGRVENNVLIWTATGIDDTKKIDPTNYTSQTISFYVNLTEPDAYTGVVNFVVSVGDYISM